MKREDDQELWDLLGKSKGPELSPFFARNVLRTVRQGGRPRGVIFGWLRPGRLIPASAIALAVVMAGISLQHRLGHNDNSADNPPELIASIDPQDFDAVVDLDDLLASDDDNLWSDTPSL